MCEFKVAMTYERLLSIKFKKWSNIVKSKAIVITCVVIIIFFFTLNCHLLFTIDFDPMYNSSDNGACGANQMFVKWLPVRKIQINIK